MPTADELNRKGADLYLQGDLIGARLHYTAALQVNPGLLSAMKNLAVTLASQGQLHAAVALLYRIVSVDPNDGNQWNNLGNILTRLERYLEANDAFNIAAKIIPEDSGFWHNVALLQHRMGKYDDALQSIEKAESLGRNGYDLDNDKAHMLLAKGNLEQALVLYEARWNTLIHLPPWDYHIPEWQGEDLNGKQILLHMEQGFGDTIMSARFINNLLALGAKVTLCVSKSLIRLFANNWPSIDVVDINTLDEDLAKHFDFQSPMYSTMRWLGITTNSISSKPYIKAPALAVPPVYKGIRNVGICWASGKRNADIDWRRRVTDLKDWLILATLPDVQLWSLQKDEERNVIEALGAETLVCDIMPRLDDWAETAAFVNKLDVIVSVDTAIAHLSAAMGKPTIMLSQFSNCWRWWNIESKSGRPWYDCMTIFKQPEPRDWEYTISEAFSMLALGAKEMKVAA